jgi:thiamine-phosphate pyrophosphorylase
MPSGGLYAITDGPRTDLLNVCEAALRGGAAVLQYRDKTNQHARRRDEAVALNALCNRYRVPLIINDDIDLALESGAAGIHLGEDDSDVVIARNRLGNVVIGVSCYDSLERASTLARDGADYLAFGAFFPSPTKPAARRPSLAVLAAAKQIGLPVVAIGGITPDNAPSLIAAGADFVAAISGIFGTNDPSVTAARYVALFQK